MKPLALHLCEQHQFSTGVSWRQTPDQLRRPDGRISPPMGVLEFHNPNWAPLTARSVRRNLTITEHDRADPAQKGA